MEKMQISHGPKAGKKGYLDRDGRIWIKDRGHSGQPDHWDVQIDGGLRYLKVAPHGNEI